MSDDAGLHHFTAKVIGEKVFSLTVQGGDRHGLGCGWVAKDDDDA